jgi:type 1 fimbria pilin
MRRNGKNLGIGVVALALVAFLAGPALTEGTMTITGTVNEDSQIVTDDGKVYEVVDSEMGGEVVEKVDKKVKVTGTVEEDAGKMTISVTNYEVLEQ